MSAVKPAHPDSLVSEAEHRPCVVVGGGVSGLVSAWRLQRAGKPVVLLEAGDGVGGAMRSMRADGCLLEQGPFNVMVRDASFRELLSTLEAEAGLEVVKADPKAAKRYLYRHGGIHAVPTNPVGFLTTPLLSKSAALRAMRGLLISSRGRAEDCTLEEFAQRRFGSEIADTFLSAVVAGILAGDISKLSAYDAFPVLREFDQQSFSPLGRTLRRMPSIMRKARDPEQKRWKGLVSFGDGLGGLAEILAKPLGDDARIECRVQRLLFDGEIWRIEYAAGGEGSAAKVIETPQLILATPAGETAGLIGPHAPSIADELRGVESASLTVLNLIYRRDAIGHPLDGFGFLVPRNEPDYPLMGVLFADSAFPHHAPPDKRVLRAFLGGTRTPNVLELSDDELLARTLPALRETLAVKGEPLAVHACRYPDAIPQYYIGHAAKVARIRAAAAPLKGLTLVGNYLDGVSINDCVKTATQAANELIQSGVLKDS
jgi:oxygen-dependent protoporphyrinogen oxidase